MKDKRTHILIIDVATSGFRVDLDTILEVACIVCDGANLDILDTCNYVVRQPGTLEVPDFHQPLLKECGGPEARSMAAVDGLLLAGPWSAVDVLCNRALDFDLKFLLANMPDFHKAVTRNRPQLELKAFESLYVSVGGARFQSSMPRTYRAADDAVAAYEELAYYRDILLSGVTA